MADKPIHLLSNFSTITGGETIPCDNGVETGSITPEMLRNYVREQTSDCGIQGEYNFSVAPCNPNKLPSALSELEGTWIKNSSTYGNYKDPYGGHYAFFPRTWIKIENVTVAPYYGTKVTIVKSDTYPTEAEASAAGFFCHRAFYNAGQMIDGFFFAKYKPALANYVDGVSGIASPLPMGSPISSSSTTKKNSTNPTYPGSFSNCISNSQTPTDDYNGAMSAMKSQGNDFFCATIFQTSYIALVSLAQSQSATIGNCAFNDVLPYAPKGNNKAGVLSDYNDTAVVFSNPTDGYWNGTLEAALNGSGVPFAKTTHNGCPNGVADVNGNQYEILPGLTAVVASKSITAISIATEAVFTSATHGYSNGQIIMLSDTATPSEWSTQLSEKMYTVEVVDVNTYKLKQSGAYIDTSSRSAAYTSGISSYYGTFYVYKESVDVKSVTPTQHFDPTWIATNCDVVTPNFVDGGLAQSFGNGTNQVLSGSTVKATTAHILTACGLPMANGFNTLGTNNFGADLYYQYYRDKLCVLGSGYWANAGLAGVWCRYLDGHSTHSTTTVSARPSLIIV